MDTIKYQVLDSRTGGIKGEYDTMTRAHKRADKLDMAYGAIRYIVKKKLINRPHGAGEPKMKIFLIYYGTNPQSFEIEKRAILKGASRAPKDYFAHGYNVTYENEEIEISDPHNAIYESFFIE